MTTDPWERLFALESDRAVYNEIDPFAAQWLRNLIAAGYIADGVVDGRSINELAPADMGGPGQRHFFAGIAGWSLALRLAGIPDDAGVWTGSCPCQPFSDAGRGTGFDDDRHLWPAWFRLIRECRPGLVFGEQVASAAGLVWLDAVHADLEGAGYTVRAADLCAASVGAPHRRQRLFFVAYADAPGRGELWRSWLRSDGHAPQRDDADRRGEDGALAHADGRGRDGRAGHVPSRREQPDAARGGSSRGMADSEATGRGARRIDGAHGRPTIEPVRHGDDLCDCGHGHDSHCYGTDDCDECSCTYFLADPASGGRSQGFDVSQAGPYRRRGSADGGWSRCSWIPCSDGVARPVEPGTHPLAHGAPARVGKLRAYGNAIVPQVAAAFVRAALEAIADGSGS